MKVSLAGGIAFDASGETKTTFRTHLPPGKWREFEASRWSAEQILLLTVARTLRDLMATEPSPRTGYITALNEALAPFIDAKLPSGLDDFRRSE